MLGWLRQWRDRQLSEAQRQAEASVARIRADHERLAMDRQKRDLFYGLGFDLNDADQSWLRQAQLMREHHDKIAEMQARIERLEGRRGYLD